VTLTSEGLAVNQDVIPLQPAPPNHNIIGSLKIATFYGANNVGE